MFNTQSLTITPSKFFSFFSYHSSKEEKETKEVLPVKYSLKYAGLHSGFPSKMQEAKMGNVRRYKGRYYYCSFSHSWYFILDTTTTTWCMVKVDEDGKWLTKPVKHNKSIFAGQIADFPFTVKAGIHPAYQNIK